ncbi:glycosyl hydrolase, family 18, putative [Cordyceps militaris CM01]|uniref:chitinase n=1 Tax=Cordyceps militaris (strain CM01) TaxID=983644 RepID=G3JTN9_CORMM|nr:glycosyl hydrolase, family 18, putative [Cordyceps militaris CM01]EGX88043.1 glycosyl hydrolase, family 18, putative [Cordyceps militaris CM01]
MRQQLSFSALTLVTLLLAAKAQESHGVETEIYQDSILDEAPTVVGNKDYLEEPPEDPRTFYSDLHPCPRACDGKHSDEWDLFTSIGRLEYCIEPMLIDVALYNPLDDKETITVIRACTQGNANSRVNAAFGPSNGPEFHNAPLLNRRNILSRPRRSSLECPVGKDRSTVIQLSMSGSSPKDGHLDAAVFLLHQVLELFQESATCHTKSMLGYLNGTVVGVYAGTSINKASVHSVLEEITPLLTKEKVANATAQICDSRGSARDVVGVAISSNGDLAAVQDALRLWDRVDCAANLASAQEIPVVIQAEANLAMNQTMTSNTAFCISNCGMSIVSSGPPAAYGRVGYYESWNFERNCLYLKAEHANTDGTYTIIHWAFMEIDTENWKPKIKDPHAQWEGFKSLTGVKKVISFGGWGYSTAPETYNILRQAMSPTHRLQFAGNVVKFIIEHGLDGVDFDWEYPGATDIPDTPPGSPEDGQNYLAFLIVMSNKIHRQPPYHYTLSIAAPASFWYLKAFPIEVMSWYLDYIVYMTYDLHGQWDAGNQWSTEGCPAGNCLRSHINLTETETALAMITKAGVPSKRIYVGEASYGRSFKMSHEGCDGPDCTFEGDRMHSQAAPGICTDTSGYISYAEISRIIENDSSSRPWHDHDSNSDIMVYQETEWVAYMTPTTKDTRRNFWKGKNFAGTIDWAVDLMSYHSDDESFGHGEDWSSEFEGGTISPGECKGTYASLEDIEKDRDSIPLHCRDEYTLVALSFILKDSISKHDELIQDHYDHNFGVYAEAVANGAQNTVKDFMYKNASEFFTCQVTEVVDSCKHCWDSWIRKGNNRDKTRLCRYCEDYVCGSTVLPMICWEMNVPCPDPLHQFLFREKDFACPPDFSERSDEPDKDNLIRSSTRWTLKEGKSDAFYAALLAGTDVSSDKIVWEDVRWHDADGPPSYHAHEPMYMDFNFPNPKYYKKEDVMNPKEVINKGREKLNSIMPTIDDVLGLVQQNKYAGLVGDLVDALSVPIAMAQQSVANMQRANDIGQNIDDEQKKNFIILFLTAILFFIPFVGEIAGTIGVLAGVARIITVVGELGAVGLDIYSLVDSKGNDPFAIAGILFAPLALYDVAAVAAAAALRRGMKERQITSIGNEAKQTLDKIDRIKGRKSGARASCPVKREVEPIKVAWENALLKSSLNDTPVVRSGLE